MANLNGYSDSFAMLLQNHLLVTGSAWSPVTTDLWVGLSQSSVLSNGDNWAEPSTVGTAYARVNSGDIGSGTLWGPAIISATAPNTVIQSSNSVDEIVFPTATASWMTVVAAGVFGTEPPVIGPVPAIYFGGNLAAVKTIEIDTSPVFLTNSFKISTSNA